jgi:hypothetical protein
MGIKDMAAKAKEKLTGESATPDEGIETAGDKFDNATGERYGESTDRAQEAINERLDDFTRGDSRQNRDIGGA